MDFWENIYWENFPNSPKCGMGVALNTNSLKLYEMQPSSTEFMKPANQKNGHDVPVKNI